MLTRGLIVCGTGETEYDALYDLLSTMYIIPSTGNVFLRVLSFLKLTIIDRVSISAAIRLFRFDHRTADEKAVMKLANQTLLSTAEIIRFIDKNIHRIRNNDSIVESIYADDDTTSDNIADMVKSSRCSQHVTLAVANLYLRQQLILDR